ncbi:DUF1697 domain-containing protein [Hyphomonas chukchiensis]|uniref:DUF1697 domain-containing protein n=1 Tax=Hyphomonas chukchiensis TaxID=1280947 RepID=A0A062UFQ1_9PROT|nr:DUF1697 domain-containing protein [Hyphomonas chukchiensis]KCZ60753.1 hypothetical protein HY30_00040 [Hyphomonas chukchiensis]
MTAYVALLRAVNVGGTGKLAMTELAAMCTEAGFADVKTYIASGNVVFRSDLPEAKVRAALDARLEAYAGKPVGVFVRSAREMAAVRDNNPFPDEAGNRVVAIFLEAAPKADALAGLKHQTTEVLKTGTRELYVFYPDGQGQSKLQIPSAKSGTGRNMNTVAKLAEMAAALNP